MTPNITVRVDGPMLEGARVGLGLPPGVSPTELIRFALAKFAGMPDPQAAARLRPPGPPPRRRT